MDVLDYTLHAKRKISIRLQCMYSRTWPGGLPCLNWSMRVWTTSSRWGRIVSNLPRSPNSYCNQDNHSGEWQARGEQKVFRCMVRLCVLQLREKTLVVDKCEELDRIEWTAVLPTWSTFKRLRIRLSTLIKLRIRILLYKVQIIGWILPVLLVLASYFRSVRCRSHF